MLNQENKIILLIFNGAPSKITFHKRYISIFHIKHKTTDTRISLVDLQHTVL